MDSEKKPNIKDLYNKYSIVALDANTGLDENDAIVAIQHLGPLLNIGGTQSLEEFSQEVLEDLKEKQPELFV